jgi:hypothetical protein
MCELDSSERLIVWSFRRWVLGLRENRGEHWSLVWNEFTRLFGAREGKEALSGFAALLKGVQCHARRTIHHHQPCCPCLGDDEAAVMRLVAACQSHQLLRARSIAEWLVEPDGVGEILQAGTRLAHIMRQHALILPDRAGGAVHETAIAQPETASITVH